MKFIEFLAQAKQSSFWKEHRVICFRGDAILFFQTLFSFLKQKDVALIKKLQVNDKKELWSSLQQSFLGETHFYWLSDVTASIKTKKNEPNIVEILSLYRGPHSIAFCLPDDYELSLSVQKRMAVVDVPKTFSVAEVEKIFSFFEQKLSQEKRKLLHEVASKSISIDAVCMLKSYFLVTSVRFGEHLKDNLAAIIEPQSSLYSLAQAFFKKQGKTFFSLWSEKCNEYTVPFWTTYWAEQLWRAHYVVKFMQQNNYPAARRFAFRLPASFIKGDWRLCSTTELKKSYEMIYDIDYAFKRGSLIASSFCSLDLFYCNFLNKPVDR